MAVPQKIEQDQTDQKYDTSLFPIISPDGHINGRYFSTEVALPTRNKFFLLKEDYDLFLDETKTLEALYGFEGLNPGEDNYDMRQKCSLTRLTLLGEEFPNKVLSTDAGDTYIPLEQAEEVKYDAYDQDGRCKRAIFLVECLSSYFKYLGICFPHIQASKSEDDENRLEYSFIIPVKESFSYQNHIMGILSAPKTWKAYTNEDGTKIYINGQVVASLEEDDYDQKRYWVARRIQSPSDAVKLFYLLAIPLRS